MVIFSEITKQECIKEGDPYSKAKTRLVQHCATISAIAKLFVITGIWELNALQIPFASCLKKIVHWSKWAFSSGCTNRALHFRPICDNSK